MRASLAEITPSEVSHAPHCGEAISSSAVPLGGRKFKTDPHPWLVFRSHKFPDRIDEILNCAIVRVHAFLEFIDLGGQSPVRSQHLAQSNKGPHDENAHLDGPLGIEHGRGHDRSMLGEYVRQISSSAAALF